MPDRSSPEGQESTDASLNKQRDIERQRRLFEQAPGFIIIMEGPRHIVEFVNDAHRRLFDSSDWVGKPIREAFPAVEGQGFFELLDKVFQTGEAVRATAAEVWLARSPGSPRELRYHSFTYAPLFSDAHQVTGIFCEGIDVTETQVSEKHARALAALGDRIREIDDPDELAFSAAQILGETLGVSRAGYGTIITADETISIERDWNMPGVQSLAGVLQFRDYGSYIEDLKAGRTVVIADAEKDPRTAAGAAALKAITAHSFVNMPVTEQGGFVALLYLNHAYAREWTLSELTLIREVAERTRTAVERRRAEIALRAEQVGLRETEERYRLAAKATNDAIWDWRMEDGHVVWNEALNTLFGHDRLESSAEWWIEHIHPEDRARVDHSIHAVIDGSGTAWTDQYRFLRADGSYADVLDRGAVLRDVAGRPVRMIGAMLDLTERRAAEERVRVSETRYRTLFEAIEVGFCVVEVKFDASGQAVDYRMVEINPAFERQTGLYGAAGKWVSEVAPGLERHWFDTYGRVAQTGHSTRFENFAEPFGRWYDVYAFRVDDPERHHVAILFSDVTQRRSAEEQLRSLNETLEQQVAERTADRDRLWRNSQDLLLIARFDTTIVAVNPAWTTTLGWRDDELVGRNFTDFIHPDDLPGTNAEASSLAGEGRTTMRFENRYRRKAGEWVWLSWAVTSGAGHYHAVARDVTSDKMREAELEQAQEALRQSQKMEAVGQLTGGIAHDFNNMLAVVIGSLDLLNRRIGKGDDRTTHYVEAAKDAARRAAQLTQRLLAFSRQQPLKPESVDANKLVNGMSELLRHSLGADVRLETVLSGGLWRTHADPNQLENAILNLAVNSRDAMPEGGRLTIETANCHLDRRYVAANLGVPVGQYVMVAVTDTGSGMSSDVIAKAFDPFFTTKEVGKGTGLGLSQVYGFVKQSGGHVKIYSEIGHGTTVKIYLPRLVGGTEEVRDEQDSAALITGEQREVILVVEDEPAVRQFSIDALNELGYKTLEADGAIAALKLLDAHPEIVLLFTDVVMPDTNGKKLAEEALRRRPDLKVLFTTGYTRNAVVHNGVLDAGVELIGKPFTIDELALKVREVLDGQKS